MTWGVELTPECAAQSAAMEAKLAAMRDGRVAVVSPEAKVAAERLSLALFDEWTRRRRIFRDCYDALLESVETKPAQLKNDVRPPQRALRSTLHADDRSGRACSRF